MVYSKFVLSGACFGQGVEPAYPDCCYYFNKLHHRRLPSAGYNRAPSAGYRETSRWSAIGFFRKHDGEWRWRSASPFTGTAWPRQVGRFGRACVGRLPAAARLHGALRAITDRRRPDVRAENVAIYGRKYLLAFRRLCAG